MNMRIDNKPPGTVTTPETPPTDTLDGGWKVERDGSGAVKITPPDYLQGGVDFWSDFELALNQNADGPIDIDAILALVVKMCALRQKNDREARLGFLASRLEAMTAAGDEALKAATKRFIGGVVGGSFQIGAGVGNLAGSVNALGGIRKANSVLHNDKWGALKRGEVDAKALCPEFQVSHFNKLTMPSQSWMRLAEGASSVGQGTGQLAGARLELDAAQREREKMEKDKQAELANFGVSSSGDGLQGAKEDERSYMNIINNLEQNRTDTEKMVIQYI